MASKLSFKVDFAELQASVQRQFSGLNPNDPSSWPALPKYALYLLVTVAVVVGLWFVVLSSYQDELEAEAAKEVALREDYKKKLVQAVNLDALKKQREQVQQYVTQLEKQLPSKAEMDALLSDINQAGLGRGLQFELFRPGQQQVKDYYAELPIAIRVTGRYHDVGSFAADVANLSRIVTLQNLTLLPVGPAGSGGVLSLDATARTYRYLDAAEIAEQKRASVKPGAPK